MKEQLPAQLLVEASARGPERHPPGCRLDRLIPRARARDCALLPARGRVCARQAPGGRSNPKSPVMSGVSGGSHGLTADLRVGSTMNASQRARGVVAALVVGAVLVTGSMFGSTAATAAKPQPSSSPTPGKPPSRHLRRRHRPRTSTAADADADADADPTTPPTKIIAALGDSITQAMSTSCGAFTDCPANSWATGTNADRAVRRHAARSRHPTRFNIAVSGAKSGALLGQAQTAMTQSAQYVTIEIGANDACTPTVGEMTPTPTSTQATSASRSTSSRSRPAHTRRSSSHRSPASRRCTPSTPAARAPGSRGVCSRSASPCSRTPRAPSPSMSSGALMSRRESTPITPSSPSCALRRSIARSTPTPSPSTRSSQRHLDERLLPPVARRADEAGGHRLAGHEMGAVARADQTP